MPSFPQITFEKDMLVDEVANNRLNAPPVQHTEHSVCVVFISENSALQADLLKEGTPHAELEADLECALALVQSSSKTILVINPDELDDKRIDISLLTSLLDPRSTYHLWLTANNGTRFDPDQLNEQLQDFVRGAPDQCTFYFQTIPDAGLHNGSVWQKVANREPERHAIPNLSEESIASEKIPDPVQHHEPLTGPALPPIPMQKAFPEGITSQDELATKLAAFRQALLQFDSKLRWLETKALEVNSKYQEPASKGRAMHDILTVAGNAYFTHNGTREAFYLTIKDPVVAAQKAFAPHRSMFKPFYDLINWISRKLIHRDILPTDSSKKFKGLLFTLNETTRFEIPLGNAASPAC